MINGEFLQQRDRLLNEYSQAVDSYQKRVLELAEARKNSVSGVFCNLLAEADAAKRILNHCRDLYQNHCTSMGAVNN